MREPLFLLSKIVRLACLSSLHSTWDTTSVLSKRTRPRVTALMVLWPMNTDRMACMNSQLMAPTQPSKNRLSMAQSTSRRVEWDKMEIALRYYWSGSRIIPKREMLHLLAVKNFHLIPLRNRLKMPLISLKWRSMTTSLTRLAFFKWTKPTRFVPLPVSASMT